jgi:NO-binding membrane sensor protein with MHYT domain
VASTDQGNDETRANIVIENIFPNEQAVFVFILASVIMGGGAAWLTGRAIAQAWRPWWRVLLPMLLLACAIRFIHYAVFRGVLLSLTHYALDAAVCIGIGLLSFRMTRVDQMATRYNWINERTSLLGWQRRSP